MNTHCHTFLVQFAFSTFCLAIIGRSPVRADLPLADGGRSDYQIVIPANPLPSERYAAEELQRYLHKITGAQLPIRSDTDPVQAREILLGANARLANLNLKIDFKKLGPEGFIIRSVEDRLMIAGGKPRGTLYGVYSFLEDHLGVRWFTPELEIVPRVPRLSILALNETQVPALEYREVFWTEILRDANFAARLRLNGNHYRLTEQQGGRPVVYFPFVHSLDQLVPPSLYAEHPEYFPLINGQRVSGYVQRCLSNPEVVKMSIARVRQWIHDHPEATIISVSQNDTGKWCQCDRCKAFDDAEGSPSASLLRFVNAIAENIEKDYPQIRIDTLAYQYTRKPPKTLRPRPNVIIRLCSIECCFAHPLATCPAPENIRFRDDIIAWEPVAPLLYVWDYTPNFAHYQQPFPNFDALQPNVRFFVEHRVRGLFEQGNYSPGGNGEMGPLRAYLLAKLLWNPKADLLRHQQEFLSAYYGKAAPKIAAYLDLLERPAREKGVHAHIYDPPKAAYLAADFLTQADSLFAEADQLADNDDIRFRIQVAQLPVWYVQIATDRLDPNTRSKRLQEFLEVARKAGVSHISESQSLEAWAKKMSAHAKGTIESRAPPSAL